MDHLVDLCRSPLVELEKPPYPVEGRDGELSLPSIVVHTATAGRPASAIATSSSEYS